MLHYIPAPDTATTGYERTAFTDHSGFQPFTVSLALLDLAACPERAGVSFTGIGAAAAWVGGTWADVYAARP